MLCSFMTAERTENGHWDHRRRRLRHGGRSGRPGESGIAVQRVFPGCDLNTHHSKKKSHLTAQVGLFVSVPFDDLSKDEENSDPAGYEKNSGPKWDRSFPGDPSGTRLHFRPGMGENRGSARSSPRRQHAPGVLDLKHLNPLLQCRSSAHTPAGCVRNSGDSPTG